MCSAPLPLQLRHPAWVQDVPALPCALSYTHSLLRRSKPTLISAHVLLLAFIVGFELLGSHSDCLIFCLEHLETLRIADSAGSCHNTQVIHLCPFKGGSREG